MEIRRSNSLEESVYALAKYMTDLADDAVSQHGRFFLAISGGRTPWSLFRLLSESSTYASFPWGQTELFWVDERVVPYESSDSNYRIVADTLLKAGQIPVEQVHPMPIHHTPFSEAAANYESEIRNCFDKADIIPAFDLLLLGIGEDGHTASLFPGSHEVHEKERWVLTTTEPHGNPLVKRMTFALPLINKSHHVAFLVSGVSKKQVLNSILGGVVNENMVYPAALVRPKGQCVWFLDQTTQ